MSEVDDTRFGRLLHGHRTRVGLTQRELADLSTVSVRAIRDLEQGRARRPRQDTVRLVADALRLGRQAREDLERAAHQGRTGWSLRTDYAVELAPAPGVQGPLIGREVEVDALVEELRHSRLVGLVGLSGVGKTRVAVEVAARAHRGGVPVLWVGVDCPIRDERLAAVVQAGVAGLCRTGDERAAGDLAELIAGRETLLVLDDPARVLDGERVKVLLRDCPALRVLVVGTAPADLPGERPFLLSALGDEAAVRLFLHHARAERPVVEDETVAGICAGLDGLPRALAAAASWLAVYDPVRLAVALRDDPLDHVEGVLRPSGVREGLVRCVRDLPDPGLLGRLPQEFTLDDVVAVTGGSLPESGRLVRGLLLRGVVRPHLADRFRVPALVRAVLAQMLVAV